MKKSIGYHATVMLAGVISAIEGAATAWLLYESVTGFVAVATGSGYKAIGDFFVSAIALAAAFAFMYLQGKGKKLLRKRGRFSR